jgi:hypothetical protein
VILAGVAAGDVVGAVRNVIPDVHRKITAAVGDLPHHIGQDRKLIAHDKYLNPYNFLHISQDVINNTLSQYRSYFIHFG